MRFTLDTHKQNLKQVSRLLNEAYARDDKPMIFRWYAERNRILSIINNWETNDG